MAGDAAVRIWRVPRRRSGDVDPALHRRSPPGRVRHPGSSSHCSWNCSSCDDGMSAVDAIPRYSGDHVVGLPLLDTALNWCRANGADDVSLGSIRPNDAARSAAPAGILDGCHPASRVGRRGGCSKSRGAVQIFSRRRGCPRRQNRDADLSGRLHHLDWPNLPRHELPSLRNAAGAVAVYGTNPAARQDAFSRVPLFSRDT
jgi:hypothetical protein